MKCIVLLLSLLLLGFISNSQSIDKEFKVSPGKRLTVDLKTGGTVKITGWDKDVVRVVGRIDGRDAGECAVDVEEESDGVHIVSHYARHKRSFKASLDLDISVPARFDLDLETMGGGITIDGVEGRTEGRTMGGPLNLTHLKGSVDLTTMGGRISLTNSDVDGRVKTMGGDVLVEDVTGDVKASSQGGKVVQRNVNGKPGEGIKSEVSIETMGGDINVDDAPTGTNVHTMGGDIHIKRAARYARAKTMGGAIEIDAIDGRVDAVTMGGDVNVTMVGDPAKGERSVNIESMGGDVSLTVPAGLSMDVDITLAYTEDRREDYRIVSDFDVKQEETKEWDHHRGSARKYIYGTGSIAGGRNKVYIRTVNGNVYLKKG